MTNVKYVQEGNKHSLEICGHAGYNPGCDIVCSGASVLAYTLLETINGEEEKGNIEIRESSVSEGEVKIIFREHTDSHDRINGIMNAIMTGYEMLADQYPNNVVVEW